MLLDRLDEMVCYNISKCDDGYCKHTEENKCPVQEVKDLLEKDKLEIKNVQPTDCIIFRFSTETYALEDVHFIFKELNKKFPTNTIVCFPDDTSLQFFTKEELANWIDIIKKNIDELE